MRNKTVQLVAEQENTVYKSKGQICGECGIAQPAKGESD